MLKNKNVFISGGNGVIGKELVRILHEMGSRIFVGDLKPRPQHWPQSIQYRQGDLNYITPEEILDFEPEYFFHLAATFERSTETYDFWYENHKHNSQLGFYLMSIFKDSKSLKKIVNCSSYLIYQPELYYFSEPAEQARRLVENDPIYPRNLTGVAKLYHEIELRFLNEYRGEQFKSVSARIFRSYGKNSRDIISRWIRALLKKETITLYRKEGLFDYIYAGDVAQGLIELAINKNAEGIYNLGTGNARRVYEIVDILKKYFPDLTMVEKEIDIPYEGSEADITKLQHVVNWKPQMRLEDAIPLMIQHEKEFGFEDDTILPESNILITSISDKVPLLHAVEKAASKIGAHVKVFGGDLNPECIGAFLLKDKFWQMPRIDVLDLETVVRYCEEKKIKLIIPSRDGELLFWAKLKPSLEIKGITVLVSDEETVELCLDKLLFFNSPITKQFPLIPTSDQLENIQAETYVVKERYGAGSANIGLNLSKIEAQNFAKHLKHPIFQVFIEGQEFSVDIYIDKSGKVKGLVPRTRDIVVNGESQITTTLVDEKLSELCSSFATHIGLYGHAVLQLFKDSKGNYHIIECNSRFGGASTLSITAGLDTFYWALLEASNTTLDAYPFFKKKHQLKQIRIKKDIIQSW